ncbi:hypothetical protein BQ1740_3521 [Bacillus subtilis]|nr:hypothetical protein BQ1740_3521 [Bacillus subtilis]
MLLLFSSFPSLLSRVLAFTVAQQAKVRLQSYDHILPYPFMIKGSAVPPEKKTPILENDY